MRLRRRTDRERIAHSVAKMLERDCSAGEDFTLEVHSWQMFDRTDRGAVTIEIRGRVKRKVEQPPGEPLVLTPEMVESIKRRGDDDGIELERE